MVKIMELISSPFEEIPTPIIWDILSKLPTKTCLNCKLVCKEWYDIITNRDFADLRRSSGCYSTILLYGKFDGTLNFVLFDLDNHTKVDETCNLIVDNDAMIKFKSKYTNSNEQFNAINECNGLILLRSINDHGAYIVCNVVTRQHVIVELDPKHASNYAVMEGLGYCTVSQQFKVLRVSKCRQTSIFVAEIQTLGTNKWRIVNDKSPILESCDKVVFINGSLHIYTRTKHCITSFDFGTETFFRIPLPDEVVAIYDWSISIYDSCLCFASYIGDDDGRSGFWVMKDYGVKESWVKLFVFEIYSDGYWGLRLPLLQMESKEILFAYNTFGLAVDNIRYGRCKEIEVLGDFNFNVFGFNPNFSKNSLGSDASTNYAIGLQPFHVKKTKE